MHPHLMLRARPREQRRHLYLSLNSELTKARRTEGKKYQHSNLREFGDTISGTPKTKRFWM